MRFELLVIPSASLAILTFSMALFHKSALRHIVIVFVTFLAFAHAFADSVYITGNPKEPVLVLLQ